MKTAALGSLLIAGLLAFAPIASAQTAADVDARLDTLYGTHEGYAEFLKSLKLATAGEDSAAVARMIAYPITLTLGGKETTLKDEKAFIAAYHDVFTPGIVSAIQNQTYETLFAKDEGVMIGDGEVWFSEVLTDEATPKSLGLKITAINQP